MSESGSLPAMCDIARQLHAVQDQIARAANDCQRDPATIQLLAVSKTKPLEAIRAAYRAGQRRFGESYAQEACTKIQVLRQEGLLDIEWHFIGPLQSNKTRLVAEHFDWVDSVDRLKIAERLNAQRPQTLPPLNLCIQVNISGEAQKSGTTETEVFDLAREIAALPHLQLRGLMGVAEDTPDLETLQANFHQLADLFQRLQAHYPAMDTLSMGMTQDMSVAIACGSTQVRIGTAIFGARDYAARSEASPAA